MLSSNLEYLLAVLLLLTLGLSAFWDQIATALKRKASWQALLMFLVYCGVIEALGLSLGWWRFNPKHILGLSILGVPIEEILLFMTFFLLTLGAWEVGKRNDSN